MLRSSQQARLMMCGQLAVTALLAGMPALAQTGSLPPLSSEEILKQLSTDPDEEPTTRALTPRVRPDVVTRICEQPAAAGTAREANNASRTLYVEAAPRVDLHVEFKFGEATLLPLGAAQLDALAKAMNAPQMTQATFIIAGHTDAEGGRDFNDRLSCERALAVRTYLVDRRGIGSHRLVPMGFGYSKLKDPANPKAAINRRVEIRLAPAESR